MNFQSKRSLEFFFFFWSSGDILQNIEIYVRRNALSSIYVFEWLNTTIFILSLVLISVWYQRLRLFSYYSFNGFHLSKLGIWFFAIEFALLVLQFFSSKIIWITARNQVNTLTKILICRGKYQTCGSKRYVNVNIIFNSNQHHLIQICRIFYLNLNAFSKDV